mmetsp:Transcript_15818/g.24289  ORF Transcript_15818/g.24289 Transcript_15818/m.24289 type:complete len:106 (-) Transcript_15818:441-758(-)
MINPPSLQMKRGIWLAVAQGMVGKLVQQKSSTAGLLENMVPTNMRNKQHISKLREGCDHCFSWDVIKMKRSHFNRSHAFLRRKKEDSENYLKAYYFSVLLISCLP